MKEPALGGVAGPLPDFVPPCLALRQHEAPAGDTWMHEIKFDGYRLQARIQNGEVRLLTRNNLDWTGRFSHVAKALARLDVQAALIDGEVVVERQNGVTSFSDLVADLKAGHSARMIYYAFDLMHLDGHDLRPVPLLERKKILESVLSKRPDRTVRYSAHILGDGTDMIQKACELDLEGIISKRADRPYRSGRTGDWIKVTCQSLDEFVIGGYLDSTAQRDAIGALVLGAFKAGKLQYAGRVGTGFSRETAAALWRTFQPLRRSTSPFVNKLDAAQRRGVIWLRPSLVAQVQYRAITGDGLLRHAAFKGLREDKAPRQATGAT